jgi:Na+/proline symporter
VFFQFALFLFLGSCLFALWPNVELSDYNAVFAKFIASDLPSGVRGLVLSALFAAAMSTLSGTINALAASSLQDVAVALFGLSRERARSVGLARILSLLWALALAACAFLTPTDKSVVDRVLEIAGIAYGGILGIFLLSRFARLASAPILVGFFLGIAFSTYLAFFELPIVGKVFWPWYVPSGAFVTIAGAFAAGTVTRAKAR